MSVENLKVFLCHGTEDKDEIRNLYDRLTHDGVEPWLDERDILPGQDWDVEIRDAVRSSHVVLVCLSSKTVRKTGYLQKEIKFVLDMSDEMPEDSIYLIPVKLDECLLPRRLSKWQSVSLFEDEAYGKLLESFEIRATELGVKFPSTKHAGWFSLKQGKRVNIRKFFVPDQSSESDDERVYSDRKAFLIENNYPILEDRVFRIFYGHKDDMTIDTVGRPSSVNGEVVMAIFRMESDSYAICTEHRGWNKANLPIFTGTSGDDEVFDVDLFS